MNRIVPLACLIAFSAFAPAADAQLATRPGERTEGTLGGGASTRDGGMFHDAWTFPGEAGQSYFIAAR